ncbi:MAG: rhomboid family intramembrane serine protease [Flavobacteriales bacterium]|nr:rhomboid family intramembrane serine protease [Flavobacteriales bacterium]
MALLDDIKFQFRTGNILMQLIYINGGVFLGMMVLRLLFYLTGTVSTFDQFAAHLILPSSLELLLYRPWTILTHMFIHDGFLHILVNMMWLYFGGTIFLNFLDSKKLLSTYLLGGFSGAIFFVLAMNIFPVFNQHVSLSFAEGASAAVLAVMVAAATTVPNYVVHLVLIGPVKLKYVALVSVVLDVLLIPSGNAGGHFGHLGGALFGFLFATQLKQGNNLTVDFLKPLSWGRNGFPKGNKKIKVVHSRAKTDQEYNAEKVSKQEQIDAILDKIKRSGYDSLSKKEKEILFKVGKEL